MSVAAPSGVLLLVFALATTVALGIKAPLDASGGAFVLALGPDEGSPASRGQ